MIVVRVELWSAITGVRTELARMHIANDGSGTARRATYEGKTFVGRRTADLDRERVAKMARLADWPRNDFHVWNLVARMLEAMGYDKGRAATANPGDLAPARSGAAAPESTAPTFIGGGE